LVYSITDRKSFEEISRYAENIFRVKEVDSFPLVLVGNKVDLEEERKVTLEEGSHFIFPSTTHISLFPIPLFPLFY